MPVPTNVLDMDSALHTASGDSGWLPTSILKEIAVDVNLTSVRGASPSIAFFVDRQGEDQIGYPVYSPTALTAAGTVSQGIGDGAQTNAPLGPYTRLRWTIGSTAVATTVTTGATSATQLVGDTSKLLVGDVLHFATANVNRTVASITDSTHVVVSSSVTTVDGEAVTVVGTPCATFSASIEGK